jgi:hypothetical protein
VEATVKAALIAALFGFFGLFITQFLTRWREDRTKRIQLGIEHAEKQLSEFYSPLLALVEQLDRIAIASDAIYKASKKNASEDRSNIDRVMWEIYSPVHEEILTILKTKIHLIEGFAIPTSVKEYFRHYASQKIYWQLVAKEQVIKNVKTVGYPEAFYWDIRYGLSIVSQRYENSLQELRNPVLSRFANRTSTPVSLSQLERDSHPEGWSTYDAKSWAKLKETPPEKLTHDDVAALRALTSERNAWLSAVAKRSPISISNTSRDDKPQLTWLQDEARRIAANIAKLPELLKR